MFGKIEDAEVEGVLKQMAMLTEANTYQIGEFGAIDQLNSGIKGRLFRLQLTSIIK